MEIEDVLAEYLLEFIDEDDEHLDRPFHEAYDGMAMQAATDPAPSVSPPPPQSSVTPPQRFCTPVDDETKCNNCAIPDSTVREILLPSVEGVEEAS